MNKHTKFVIRRKGTDKYCELPDSTCRPAVPFEAAHVFRYEDDLSTDDLLEDEEAVEVVLRPGKVIQLPRDYDQEAGEEGDGTV